MNSGTISVSLAETDGDELRLLANWLRDEDDLRGRVRLAQRPVQAGHMGAMLDSVTVLATSGTTTTLVTSLFAWLRHRRSTQRVTLRVGHLELTCGSADDATQVLNQLRDAIGER